MTNKFDRAQEVAVAMNEIMSLESADEGALLDVVLNYFCEDTGKHQQDSDSDSDDSGLEENHNDRPHSTNTQPVSGT